MRPQLYMTLAALILTFAVVQPAGAHQARVARIARAVGPTLCRTHGHVWNVTCEQNRVQRGLWTCFVFDDHIHKCSRAEARMVMRGKYRVRIYRG